MMWLPVFWFGFLAFVLIAANIAQDAIDRYHDRNDATGWQPGELQPFIDEMNLQKGVTL